MINMSLRIEQNSERDETADLLSEVGFAPDESEGVWFDNLGYLEIQICTGAYLRRFLEVTETSKKLNSSFKRFKKSPKFPNKTDHTIAKWANKWFNPRHKSEKIGLIGEELNFLSLNSDHFFSDNFALQSFQLEKTVFVLVEYATRYQTVRGEIFEVTEEFSPLPSISLFCGNCKKYHDIGYYSKYREKLENAETKIRIAPKERNEEIQIWRNGAELSPKEVVEFFQENEILGKIDTMDGRPGSMLVSDSGEFDWNHLPPLPTSYMSAIRGLSKKTNIAVSVGNEMCCMDCKNPTLLSF